MQADTKPALAGRTQCPAPSMRSYRQLSAGTYLQAGTSRMHLCLLCVGPKNIML